MIVWWEEHFVGHFMGLLSSKYDLFIKFFQFVLKDLILMTDVKIVQILHKGLHMLNSKLSWRRKQPICKNGELALMILEEFDAGLSLLVVFLFEEIGDFLFNHVLDDVEDSKQLRPKGTVRGTSYALRALGEWGASFFRAFAWSFFTCSKRITKEIRWNDFSGLH